MRQDARGAAPGCGGAAGRAAGGVAPVAAGLDTGGQRHDPGGEVAQVPPDQDDQRPGQPVPAAAASRDRLAQGVDDAGEAFGRGGGVGHDRITNTDGRGLGKWGEGADMTWRIGVFGASVALSLAACGVTPAGSRALAPAEPVQPGDDRLTCAELDAQMREMDAIARRASAAMVHAESVERTLWPGAGFGDDQTAMWLQAERFRDAEQVQRAQARAARLRALSIRRQCG